MSALTGSPAASAAKRRKPPTFPPNARMRDGLKSWCRACSSAATQRWREGNPDYVAAYNLGRRVPVLACTRACTRPPRRHARRLRQCLPELQQPRWPRRTTGLAAAEVVRYVIEATIMYAMNHTAGTAPSTMPIVAARR